MMWRGSRVGGGSPPLAILAVGIYCHCLGQIIGVRKPIYEGKQTLSCRRVRNVPYSSISSTGAFAVGYSQGSAFTCGFVMIQCSVPYTYRSAPVLTLLLQGLTVSVLYQNKSTRECSPLRISEQRRRMVRAEYGKCAHYGHDNVCFPSQIGFLSPIRL